MFGTLVDGSPTSAGRLSPPRRSSRCTGPPIRSMQYGTAAKMPLTSVLPSSSFSPSSVSLIAFGWPGRLMISACLRITADLARQDRRRHELEAHLAHLLAESGHLLVARRRASPRASRRAAPGPVPPVVSTRWQPSSSTSSFSVASITGRSSGISRVTVRHARRCDRAAEPFLERRDAFVLVHALRGAVADRDQADQQLFVSSWCRSMR